MKNDISTTPKKRITYIDTAKAVGILLMIYGHMRIQGDELIYIYSFHMPLFFFLSGLTFSVHEGESYGNFLERKLKSFVLPYFVLAFLCLSVDCIYFWNVKGLDSLSWTWFVGRLIGIYEEKREYALWFLGALFVSENLFYLILKLGRKKWWLTTIFVAVDLAIGIIFNKYTQVWLPWSTDAAFFGVLFLALGYLLKQPYLSKPTNWILAKRWRSLLVSLPFLAGGFLLQHLLMVRYNQAHLEMWAGRYSPYYIVLPAACLLCIGVTLFCKVIDNVCLSFLGKETLVILAFQQTIGIRLYGEVVAKAWRIACGPFANGDWNAISYCLVGTLFTIAVCLPISLLFTHTPLAVLLGKKMPKWCQKKEKKERLVEGLAISSELSGGNIIVLLKLIETKRVRSDRTLLCLSISC